MTSRVALLGFLPWTDPAREVAVQLNPSAVAAERCALAIGAAFVPVGVSGDGIAAAMKQVAALDADLIVAMGQTPTGPRVERLGRVPGKWSPAVEGEQQPWLLAPDAADLAVYLNGLSDPLADTAPFVASDDAGGYFCDHLCVELVRESRCRSIRARFLHVTAVDACTPDVREARISQYARQMEATVEWLRKAPALV